MSMIKEVTEKVKHIFSSERLDALAKDTKFIQRKNKIIARDFLSHHLYSELKKDVSLADIAYEFSDNTNISLTKQAIHKKYTPEATHFMRLVLEELMTYKVNTTVPLPLIPCVKKIKTVDSSYLKLHEKLSALFPGFRNQKAGVKLQTMIDVVTNNVYLLDICKTQENDQGYKRYMDFIEAGELSINDLGYFCIDSFKTIQEKQAFFLSRYSQATRIYSEPTQRMDIKKHLAKTKKNRLDKIIYLGETAKFQCRLVAVRLPPDAYLQRLKNIAESNRKRGKKKTNPSVFDEWTIFVTNLPMDVTANTLLHLYSLRWQVELFFKAIKTFFNLRNTNIHTNPHKALVSLYSLLIGAILMTQCFLTVEDKELSLYKAAKTFVYHIKHFIYLIKLNEEPIQWMRNKIIPIALKESSPKRPAMRRALGINYDA